MLLLYATVKWGWFSNLTNLGCFLEGNFAFYSVPKSPIFRILCGVLHCAHRRREEGRGKGKDADVAAYAIFLLAILSLKRTSAAQFLKSLDFYFPPFNLVSFSTCICWRDSHCGSCLLFSCQISIKSIYHLTFAQWCRFKVLGYRWFDWTSMFFQFGVVSMIEMKLGFQIRVLDFQFEFCPTCYSLFAINLTVHVYILPLFYFLYLLRNSTVLFVEMFLCFCFGFRLISFGDFVKFPFESYCLLPLKSV